MFLVWLVSRHMITCTNPEAKDPLLFASRSGHQTEIVHRKKWYERNLSAIKTLGPKKTLLPNERGVTCSCCASFAAEVGDGRLSSMYCFPMAFANDSVSVDAAEVDAFSSAESSSSPVTPSAQVTSTSLYASIPRL